MPRMTRAQAAAVAEQLYIDDDSSTTGDVRRDDDNHNHADHVAMKRAPLGDIAPNSLAVVANDNSNDKLNHGETLVVEEPSAKLRRSTRSASKPSTDPVEQTINNNGNDDHSTPRDVSTAERLMKEGLEAPVSTVTSTAQPDNTMSGVPLSAGVVASSDNSSEPTLSSSAIEPKSLVADVNPGPISNDMAVDMQQRAGSISPVRLSTPKSQKSFMTVDSGYSATYDELEAAAVAQATPPQQTITSSPQQQKVNTPPTPPRSVRAPSTPSRSVVSTPRLVPEDPIHALDVLEDAMEKVASELPKSPEKKVSKKPAPVVRTTKAAAARISLAHGQAGPRAPSLGRPRASIGLNDVAGKRVVSNASNASNESIDDLPKKEVVIPHSKPRPMSMSFPAPPPPPKSTKAPTQSTFQLPGEAVAAKLKAAKEARLAKEAEDQKKKPFKARPVPAYLSKAPVVRQTNTSAARESLMTGKPVMPSLANGHSRASSVADHHRNRLSLSSTPTGRMSLSGQASRPGTAMALSHMRNVSPKQARPPSVMAQTSRPGGAGTYKGKEVFNRHTQSQAAAEREKREKEEATKRARAEAAERSRLLSREWAEKQRIKKVAAAASAVN